jgi:DNA repair exonuclease SbcCD ATPase subunit
VRFALILALVVSPLLCADANQAAAEARAAAAKKKAADAAVRDSQRKVSDLEKRVAQLREKLAKAEQQQQAAQPAPAGPDRKTIEDRIAALERDLPMLNSIINKIANDVPLTPAEQKLLAACIGSSIPVKVELLQILQQLRQQWERELEDLKRQLAGLPPPAPAPAAPAGPDPDAIRAELEAAERELEAAKADLERLRGDAAAAAAAAGQADLKAEAERLRKKREKIEERLRKKAEQHRKAAKKLDDEREAAASGSEAAQSMAKVLEWTREVATKLGGFLAGDVGEAIAEAATTQLEIGAKALEALPGLVPGVEGLTRNPDGTYTFNQAGQSLLHKLVDALNDFVKAQRELDSAVNEWKETTAEIEKVEKAIAGG